MNKQNKRIAPKGFQRIWVRNCRRAGTIGLGCAHGPGTRNEVIVCRDRPCVADLQRVLLLSTRSTDLAKFWLTVLSQPVVTSTDPVRKKAAALRLKAVFELCSTLY